jgi:acyl-coenzyme A thioesterase PaaI-like protein
VTDLPSGERNLAAQLGAKGRLVDGDFHGWVDVTPRLCSHGLVRGAVLVMLVDMGAGYEAEMHAERDWSFTADLSVRRSPVPTSRIEGVPVVQRAGRTISIDMPLRDADGAPTAHGIATFTRVAMRPGDPPRPDYPVDSVGAFVDGDIDLEEALAARETAAGLDVDLHSTLLNPAGVLQGGVAALIAEIAAQRVVERELGGPHVVAGIDVRYVNMGRVGPIRAVVRSIGRPDDASVVVKLLDTGANDRVVTHNLIDFVPAP